MLLAKIRDVLLNRRNKIEIEKLEGDIVYNDISLKEVTDWVSSMKDAIGYDEEEHQIIVGENIKFDSVGIDIGSISNLYDEDLHQIFSILTDQAGKVVVVNEEETGFEYKNISEESSYTLSPITNVGKVFELSRQIDNLLFLQFKLANGTGASIPAYTKIADFNYTPSSNIIFAGCVGSTVVGFILTTTGELQCMSAIGVDNNISANITIEIVNA